MADSDALLALITSFHDSNYRTCWALTGGGASAAGLLLSVPGGSRTILEMTIPYSEKALSIYLSKSSSIDLNDKPEQSCSAATAEAMAVMARRSARFLDPHAFILGFGCTASLRSDRPKRGDHRVHLAATSCYRTLTRSLTFAKEARSRAEEEDVVGRLLLNLAAEAAERKERVPVPLLPGEEVIQTVAPRDPLAEFLDDRLDMVCIESNGRVRDDGPRPEVIVCGSFNPLHAGHLGLAETATKQLGKVAAFELAVFNADKPAIPPEEVRRRSTQFIGKADLWLTHVPMFSDKACLFPGAVFVVGADTAARIIDPRFYQNNAQFMDAMLFGIHGCGCRFLVAARVDNSGKPVGLDDLNVPENHRDLFSAIAVGDFRCDISSTQLRTSKTRPSADA